MLKDSSDKHSCLYEYFPSMPIPEDIIQKSAMWEFEKAVEQNVKGKPWFEVNVNFWNWEGIMISQFSYVITPIAAHYYAPSIILGVLESPEYFDSLSGLLLPKKGNFDWWGNFFELFTISQKNCIIKLVFLLDEYYSAQNGEWYSCTTEHSDLGRMFDIWS